MEPGELASILNSFSITILSIALIIHIRSSR